MDCNYNRKLQLVFNLLFLRPRPPIEIFLEGNIPYQKPTVFIQNLINL